MHIFVKNKDLGFFTQETISVTRYDGEELIWCNHANYETEITEDYIPRPDQPDIVIRNIVNVCPKCDAYRVEGSNYWMEAPLEGVRYV